MIVSFTYLKKGDWILASGIVLLVLLSLIILYSIAQAQQEPDLSTFTKQIVAASAGFVLFVLLSLLNYQLFRTYGYLVYGVSFLLLIAVLFFGTEVRGTQGWFFIFGDIGFQPIEFAKLGLIIVLAKVLSTWDATRYPVRPLFVSSAIVGALMLPVLFQPDFGSSLILLITFLGMLFMTNVRKRYIFFVLGIILIAVVFSWFFLLRDFQKERVLTFLDPSRDPYGSGYNLKQSMIAIGSGQLLGRGLGVSPQSRLNFLPSQQTDFIFAVVAEQFGFFGSFTILALFILLAYRLVRVARFSRDDFGIYLTAGVAIMIFSQTIINIGGNVGLLPITGLPLPFVSAGGSSLIASFLAFALVQSVFMRRVGIHATP